MKKILFISLMMSCVLPVKAGHTVVSPDGLLSVTVSDEGGKASYSVSYDGHPVLEPSALGIETDLHHFCQGLKLSDFRTDTVTDDYTLDRIKTSRVHYEARRSIATFSTGEGRSEASFGVEFQVSDHNVAFRYILPEERDRRCSVVRSEETSFHFPVAATAFLTPQSHAMIGWKRSKPSYEEEYTVDRPVGSASQYGHGFTFPGLFRVPVDANKGKTSDSDIWVLVSETGVDGRFCGSRLDEPTPDGIYRIAYPMMEENNGFGSTGAQVTLPCLTPWRTLTVGGLKDVVETTVPFDLVRPLYEPSADYRYGRSTWSWMVWDDASINEKDLKAFIDLASEMSWEYTLIDAGWDRNLGREKMAELVRYARERKVEVFLWYNSSGAWNDTSQSPVDLMGDPISRKREMKWMQSLGVKGIKVDFWGGDKQETMRLYEQVLSDADDHGLMVIFHGCTLPRGWERMYPNYVGSEAVLASENLKFSQHADDMEAFNACLHPFIRNSVGCMEFGGSALNRFYSRDNRRGNRRVTGDAFELACAVLFQNPIQNFALTPNNLQDAPSEAIDFMRNVPTVWDEIRFIDGYPGRYVVLARRSGDIWYLAAVNACQETLKLDIDLSFIKDSAPTLYLDGNNLNFAVSKLKPDRKRHVRLEIPGKGGAVIVGENNDK